MRVRFTKGHGCLQAVCVCVYLAQSLAHTWLLKKEREREKERKKERERKRERKKGRKGGRERKAKQASKASFVVFVALKTCVAPEH